MVKLIILRGLPASGKSTWARAWADDPANTWPHVIVSLDAIRLALAGSPAHRDRIMGSPRRRRDFERLVVQTGHTMIGDALDAGFNVVADAQHANPAYATALAALGRDHHALVETRDFDIPLDELLERNESRPAVDHVDPEYIRAQWARYHDVMFQPLPEPDDLLSRMRGDPDVKVVPVKGERDLYACNFTREAFEKGRWDKHTIAARGLFLDGCGDVVMRGFEKFFAIDETPATALHNVLDHGKYPVTVARKENGFLGLVGAKDKPGEFRYCSKGGVTDYSTIIERLFPASPDTRMALWRLLHDGNLTAAFEVIDPADDRHIIRYDTSEIVLLALIRNNATFAQADDHAVAMFADIGGFRRPTRTIAHDRTELEHAIHDAYASRHEGVVLTFDDGWMVKVKSDRYAAVKSLRVPLQRAILRGRDPKSAIADKVIAYAREHDIDLTYRRERFDETDVDMTVAGDVLDAMGVTARDVLAERGMTVH